VNVGDVSRREKMSFDNGVRSEGERERMWHSTIPLPVRGAGRPDSVFNTGKCATTRSNGDKIFKIRR